MTWLLILQLFALGYPTPPPPPPIFQQAQQGQTVLPAHRRGPHEGEPGAVCYPGKTQHFPDRTLYECHCALLCETGAGGEPVQREADDCETACGTNQCACHPEEICGMGPDVGPEPPK